MLRMFLAVALVLALVGLSDACSRRASRRAGCSSVTTVRTITRVRHRSAVTVGCVAAVAVPAPAPVPPPKK